MSNLLNSERKGFAITFEIMMCMVLFAFVCSVTIYFAEVFQTERYFADVTSSTCQEAVRYGGNASRAYRIQVKDTDIETNANRQLAYLNGAHGGKGYILSSVGGDGRYIDVSDYPDAHGNVTVRLQFQIGDYGWGNLARAFGAGGTVRQEISLPTLMQTGRLIQ